METNKAYSNSTVHCDQTNISSLMNFNLCNTLGPLRESNERFGHFQGQPLVILVNLFSSSSLKERKSKIVFVFDVPH